MDSPLVREFFNQAQENIIVQWKGAETLEEREELHKFQQALQNFRQYFESFLLTGKVK